MGKALNKAGELRLIADYKNESIDANNAKWAVQQADVFIDFMIDHFI